MSESPASATTPDFILLSILIDKSSSMDVPDKIDGVIQGQNALLDSFAGSSSAAKAALRISQWTFDSATQVVNGFVALNSPDLVRFDHGRYQPNGTTALYDTIIAALSATRAYADQCRQQQVAAKGLVAVLTDGEDVGSKASVAEAAQAIANERQHKHSIRVIYCGIGPGQHRATAQALGIPDGDIQEVQATAQEIRAIFEVWSSRTLKMMMEQLAK
jgi:hypothetical protein